MVGSGMLYNQSKYSLAWPWNFGNSSSKTRVFLLSDHVSSGSDLNAPLGQLLEPISSSETRDVKPGLERKSSNLGISAWGASYDIGPSLSAIWALFVFEKFLRNEPQTWRSRSKTLKMAILAIFNNLYSCHRSVCRKSAGPPAKDIH